MSDPVPGSGASGAAPPSTERRRASRPPGTGVGSVTTNDSPGPALRIVPVPQPPPLTLRALTFRANTQPLMPIWGSVKGVGGQLWCEEPLADGGFLCMWAINYGPSSAITNILFDTGNFATFGMAQGMHYNIYLGTPTQLIDPIGTGALPSKWTSSFANVVVAPFATVAAALSSTGSRTVTPSSMADIRVGAVLSVQNADAVAPANGTHFERVTVTAVTATTFTAVFATTKSAGWQLVITTNIAYVVARFPAVQPGQSQPNFESFRCDHDGLLITDPIQDPTLATKFFVAEPVLAHADYHVSKVYGKGEPFSSIDWTGSVAATTALQRFDIGGGVKRYQLGLKLPGKASHDQNSEILRSHGQGLPPVFNSGLWQFWMDWIQSPSGIVLTDTGPTPNILNKPEWRFSGRQSRPTRARVSYPNPNGIAKTETTPPNDDPLLALGLVELVEKTWNIDGSPSDDQSQRLARYFRKSSAIDRQATIRVTNDGVQILPYIIVLVTSQRLHCTNAPCVVLNVANADPSSGQSSAWDVLVQPYDAAVHDDTQGSVTSTTPGAFASPDTPPPTPANPTLTQIGFDVAVGFVPVADYPFYLQQQIKVQETLADGTVLPEYVLGEAVTGPLTIRKVTMGSTYAVKAYVRNWSMLLSVVAATATITPALATPQEVVNLTVLGSTAATARAFWDQPATIVENQYGAAFWSGSNVGGFVAANVNDGSTATKAFDYTPTADTTITFDAGVGQTKDFRYIREVADNGAGILAASSVIEYSDNGSSWTAAVTVGIGFASRTSQADNSGLLFGNLFPRPAAVSGKFNNKRGWSPSGAHRFWRIRKNTSITSTQNTYELQWGEVTSINADITHYQVNDVIGAKLFSTIAADALPTSTNPLLLSTITTTLIPASTNKIQITFGLTVIACIGNDHSGGVDGVPGTFTFTALAIAQVALSNGLNSDVDIAIFSTTVNGHSLADVIGPTAAFSIGGLTPNYPNKTLTIVNRTGQLMTIVNEDASSTASNRITTQAGSNVAMASPGTVRFEYDGAATRWQLISVATPLLTISETMDLNGEGSGIVVDAAGLRRFAILKESGKNTQIRYDSSIGLQIVRVLTGSVLSPTTQDVPLEMTSTGGIKIGGGSEMKKYLSATTSWNPGTVNTGATASANLGVTGAAIGDLVIAGFDQDLNGLELTGYVDATNSVTVVLSNLSGINRTFSSGTLKVGVFK